MVRAWDILIEACCWGTVHCDEDVRGMLLRSGDRMKILNEDLERQKLDGRPWQEQPVSDYRSNGPKLTCCDYGMTIGKKIPPRQVEDTGSAQHESGRRWFYWTKRSVYLAHTLVTICHQNLPLSRLALACRCPHLLLAARVLIPVDGTLIRLAGLGGLFSGLKLLSLM